jgi:hypothetical protein
MAKEEKTGKSRQAEGREARLAAALRANLKKRKEQVRGRNVRATPAGREDDAKPRR